MFQIRHDTVLLFGVVVAVHDVCLYVCLFIYMWVAISNFYQFYFSIKLKCTPYKVGYSIHYNVGSHIISGGGGGNGSYGRGSRTENVAVR